ncbi:MAG: acyl-CoA dehydrogenase, partial [Arthrobacter sp.]
CLQSRERIHQLFGELWRNSDASDGKLASRVLAGDYTWFESGILDPSEGTGPWISERPTGVSSKENLHRAYR